MADIKESDIKNAEAILVAFINENFPSIETRTGSAFRSLIITPAATLYALIVKELATFSESLNILEIDTSTVDESVLEAQLNNFLITRKEGSTSSGLLKIAVLVAKDYVVSSTTLFLSSNDTGYSPIGDVAIPAANLLSDGDTLFFLLNVNSVDPTSTIITQGEVFTLSDTSFIDAAVSSLSAYADFSQGRAKETIEEFRDRAAESITVRDLVTDKAINTVLKEEFPEILEVVPIGYGDVEMQRDLIYPFNIHKGGDVDVFVRSDRIPGTFVIEKIVPAGLLLDLIAPEVPILKIISLTKVENNLVTTLLEGVDYTIEYLVAPSWPSTRYLDSLIARYSARFSVQELIRINFLDASLAAQQIQINAIKPTNIQGFQDFTETDDQRVITSSLLVRALCPVFISMDITYKRNVFDAPPDLDAIKTSILDYVNGTPGSEKLQVSQIVKIVQAADGVHDIELPLEVLSEIHKTDGTTDDISFSNELEISEQKSIGFSQRICQYIITEQDITFKELII
jgi:hypothetical protein